MPKTPLYPCRCDCDCSCMTAVALCYLCGTGVHAPPRYVRQRLLNNLPQDGKVPKPTRTHYRSEALALVGNSLTTGLGDMDADMEANDER